MKVAVVGANGQLGWDVVRAFATNGDEVCPLTHADIELENIDSVFRTISEMRPRVIVNTAAMHHVENCELNPQKAFAVNALGTRNLALVARETRAVFMHVSTDYVFDGGKQLPYEEDDMPRPLNVYGNSKLAGEYFAQSVTDEHFVLRTSALYGITGCRAKGGLNFIQLMLKLARERDQIRVVDTEVVSPTSTAELARQIVVLSRSDCYGLYHATAEGSCSWFKFAQTIFSFTGTRTNLIMASPDEFPAKVPRPKYSVLENLGLKNCGLNRFEPWQSGLRAYLNECGHSLLQTA
jgi:dTDP-4-dehydrorhamnose reductase